MFLSKKLFHFVLFSAIAFLILGLTAFSLGFHIKDLQEQLQKAQNILKQGIPGQTVFFVSQLDLDKLRTFQTNTTPKFKIEAPIFISLPQTFLDQKQKEEEGLFGIWQWVWYGPEQTLYGDIYDFISVKLEIFKDQNETLKAFAKKKYPQKLLQEITINTLDAIKVDLGDTTYQASYFFKKDTVITVLSLGKGAKNQEAYQKIHDLILNSASFLE